MRSRPDLTVYLDPPEPCPGDRLHTHLHLKSRSETPYDSIEVLLVGRESRYKRTDSTGKSSVRRFHRREILRLGKTFGKGVLMPGMSSQTVYFDLPRDAPPAYRSGLAMIHYELSVRVNIPWWPDRYETYAISVRAPILPEKPAKPMVFTTQKDAVRGEEPVIELSLEDQTLTPEGALRGAVAISGLGSRKLRRVEIAASCIETALVTSTAGPAEVDRRVWTLLESTPAEGSAIPFNISIPKDITPTFFSPFIRVDHALEVVAVVAFGRDLTLRVPIFVERRQHQRKHRPRDVPLVGRQRHVAVWREGIAAMRTAGHPIVASDPEHESLALNVHGLRIDVTEEHREGLGPCLVAELSWPSLALGLRVAERRWTDLGAKLEGVDAMLQDRFTIRAREAAQAAYLLGPDTRDALGVFEEAAVDDEGAVVVQKGGVYQIRVLERFLSRVEMLATRLAQSIGNLPPPAALAPALDAYARFAERNNANLRIGDLSLSELLLQGIPLSLEHRFEEARPAESLLFAEKPEKAELDEIGKALQQITKLPLLLESSRVGARLPVVQNPEEILPLADALAITLASISGRNQKGPYR